MNFYYQIDKFVVLVSKKHDEFGKKLLDVGAGQSPYKKYFKKVDYFTQDIRQNKNKTIDYVADFNKGLPMVKGNAFDYILCIQVLEHLKDPQKAFQEFYRILNPGGKVFLTTNFIYQIHMAPNDYYRFTKFGLKNLGESNGFVVEHLKPHGGVFQVLSYIINTSPIRVFFKKVGALYYLYLVLFSIPIVLLNLSAYILDFLDTDKKLAINYEVIYQKPNTPNRLKVL